MVQIVESAYQAKNAMSAVVVVRAASFEEAAGPAAKKAAIAFAKTKGVDARGYSGTSSPYPCDKDGKFSEAVRKGLEPVDHYRIDVSVQGTF